MKNPLEEQIRQISIEAKEMFLKRTDRLFLERVEKEHNLAKQYSGREILELLQNIDDAYNPDYGKDCVADFNYINNCLTVSNYGNPFTIETLQRLCQGNVSSKEGKYIGSKGIGFRSVLNWSEKVEIYSRASQSEYIAVRFSRDDADLVLEDIKTDDHIQSQIRELQRKGIDASFPIFKCPVPIDPIDGLDYNTVIKIYVRDNNNIASEIKSEIENFDKNTLLFLPHIQTVKFNYCGKELKYVKKYDNKKNCVSVSFNDESPESFYYFEDNDQTIGSPINGTDRIRMAVAIPFNETVLNCCIYSYFPILNIQSPFNALLHATFSLNANRNNLEPSTIDDSANAEVFKRLCDFYISKVVDLKLKGRVIKLLSPIKFGDNYKFPGDLARLNVEQYYLDQCRNNSIFYSINEEYLSVANDAPFIVDDVPQTFIEKSSLFRLLVRIDDSQRPFAKEVVSSTTSKIDDYLTGLINENSSNWSSSERIQIFKWWTEMNLQGLPKLIKNTQNSFIETPSIACFLSGPDTDSITDVPNWANIIIVDKDDEKELVNQYKELIQKYKKKKNSTDRAVRILPRLIDEKYMNLQEQSSKQVMISPVNNSIMGDYSRSVEFLRWLWNLWENKQFADSLKEKVDFIVPTKDSTVRPAKETYLGSALKNDLGARLFSCVRDEFSEICQISDIADIEKYSLFLRELGVNKYPAVYDSIERVNPFDDTILRKYIEHVKSSHPIEYRISSWEIKVSSIKDLSLILQNSRTEDIIRWMWNDDQLKRFIFVGTENESSYISYKPTIQGQQYYCRLNKGWNLPSYLGFVFSTTEWIIIGDHRYAPKELMIATETQIEDIADIPCMQERYIEDMAQQTQINFEDLKQLFHKLGVKESYLELSSDQFYLLLNKLGNCDSEKSKKISREIYRAIIENNRGTGSIKTEFYSDSESKQLFMKQGRVLAKNRRGDVAYVPISDVYFSSSAVLSIDDKYFIDIPPRSGNKNSFKSILGIIPYEQDYSILSYTISSLDESFQEDFKSYLPYLLAYRSGNKSTLSLSVQLVSSIDIQIDGKTQSVTTPYSLLKDTKGTWYIYIGEIVHSYDSINKCKVGESLEQVFNVYYNYPSKEFLNQVTRLFICNKEERLYFVRTELGSTYEYDMALREIQHSDELKQNLVNVLQLKKTEDVTRIIDSIDWSDLSNESVQGKIVNLLQATGKTVDELKAVIKKPITISAYNKASLRKAYRALDDTIKATIHYFCESKKKYCDFLDMCDLISVQVEKYEGNDDVNFNADERLREIVDAFYRLKGISCDDQSDPKDVYSLYESNKSEAILLAQKNNLNLNDFTNDSKNDSLLFFNDSGWKDALEEFSKTSMVESHIANSTGTMSETVEDIIPAISDYAPDSGDFRSNFSNHMGRGGVTEKSKRKNEAANKDKGNRAEYCVILALCKEKIKEVTDYFGDKGYSIIWKSGAANEVVKARDDNYEYDTSQINDGAGYDIELVAKDDQEKKLYIEVKCSSSGKCAFNMSANEFKVANDKESSGSEYRIVFVTEDNTGKRSLFFIDAPVKEVFETLPTEYNVIFNKDKYDQLPGKC